MKEYSGYDTKVNGLLIDDLRRTKGTNTIYVSHYFFALNDGKELIFYYNPMHFWDKLPIEKVDNTVLENLENVMNVGKKKDIYIIIHYLIHRKSIAPNASKNYFTKNAPHVKIKTSFMLVI